MHKLPNCKHKRAMDSAEKEFLNSLLDNAKGNDSNSQDKRNPRKIISAGLLPIDPVEKESIDVKNISLTELTKHITQVTTKDITEDTSALPSTSKQCRPSETVMETVVPNVNRRKRKAETSKVAMRKPKVDGQVSPYFTRLALSKAHEPIMNYESLMNRSDSDDDPPNSSTGRRYSTRNRQKKRKSSPLNKRKKYDD